MSHFSTRQADATKILTKRELAAVLADIRHKARRSKNARLNLMIFRLTACCGLRASEIAQLQMADCDWNWRGPTFGSGLARLRAVSLELCHCGGIEALMKT
jgi:integrase